MPHPNILMIVTDDQRFDTIGALGCKMARTPHLDALVERGVAFTNAHIPGGTCGAVCMPSRAMLNTGRTLFHLAGEGQTIPREHTLLGEFLRAHGYRTCGIGKWHNGADAFARSFDDGGEIFFGGMWDHWNVPAHSFDPSGTYAARTPYIKDAFHSRHVDLLISDHIKPGKHSTDLFADFASSWIERYDGSAPFFQYVAFMAPHDPRSMPEKFRNMFTPEDIELPPNFAPAHSFDYGVAAVRDELLAASPRTEAEVRAHLAEYYAMIAHLDDGIGRIIGALEAKGVLDDTLIVLAGDNGLALGQHGLFGKQSVYEHSVRVPLLFAGPGVAAGYRSADPCYLLDVFPTIAAYLGASVPPTVEGISLYPTLTAGAAADSAAVRDALYLAYENKVRGVKKGRYKLIEYAGPACARTQLYDVVSDPFETRDLSSAEPGRVAELRRELFRLRDEWGDRAHARGKEFWAFYDARS